MTNIYIFGASGAGCTTVGEALANSVGFTHLDADEYYWLPTDPPFTTPRPREERLAKMQEDMALYGDCVVSGSITGWGDPIIPTFMTIVYLDTPTQVRMERLAAREAARFGDRILPGGDMYENHKAFMDWASQYETFDETKRSRAKHEKWMAQCGYPVLRLDGTAPVQTLVLQILSTLY